MAVRILSTKEPFISFSSPIEYHSYPPFTYSPNKICSTPASSIKYSAICLPATAISNIAQSSAEPSKLAAKETSTSKFIDSPVVLFSALNTIAKSAAIYLPSSASHKNASNPPINPSTASRIIFGGVIVYFVYIVNLDPVFRSVTVIVAVYSP